MIFDKAAFRLQDKILDWKEQLRVTVKTELVRFNLALVNHLTRHIDDRIEDMYPMDTKHGNKPRNKEHWDSLLGLQIVTSSIMEVVEPAEAAFLQELEAHLSTYPKIHFLDVESFAKARITGEMEKLLVRIRESFVSNGSKPSEDDNPPPGTGPPPAAEDRSP